MVRDRLRALISRTAVWVHDSLMGSAAFLLAVLLRLDTDLFALNADVYLSAAAIFGLLVGVVGYFIGTNKGVWRYASLPDFVYICKTATIAACLFVVANFLITRLDLIPRSVPVIAWSFLVFLLAGPRAAYRTYRNHRDRRRRPGDTHAARRVILVGATDNAEAFIKAVAERDRRNFDVLAIIDERGRRSGRFIRGVPVVGTLDRLAETVKRYEALGKRPEALILTRTRDDYARHALLGELVELAAEQGLELLSLPDMFDFRDITTVSDLQPIELEDLLERKERKLDTDDVAHLIGGHTVLITGAGGSIGSELTRQIAQLGPARMVLVDASEFLLYTIESDLRRAHPELDLHAALCNVREKASVSRIMQTHRPSVVFHAAALKHVPIVEAQPLEGLFTNTIGTRNVAEAAVAAKVELMVMVSTDKAVNPTNVMGASKRLAEMCCQTMDLSHETGGTHFVTVRFGNVLGSAGSVIPLFEKQLKAGGPLTVTHPDVERYFMTIPEACLLILHSAAHSLSDGWGRGQIFVLDMGKPVKIIDLARNVIKLSGLKPEIDIQIVFTGLRPGEKLYEELFDTQERLAPTRVDGIFSAFPRTIEWAVLQRIIDEMKRLIELGDAPRALRLLKSTIPDFVPSREIQALIDCDSGHSAELKTVVEFDKIPGP
ncbi:hypothetical protein ASG43_00585 [Aureimonas sp. Leaf454]|uniref:polysaccharide biosynthesis protein n=1 Tax=Aureimonas sp. Leaf454 TaxID=1736381 RepID=UPI0006F39A77|nr:nucleoside-diphosphate sugar epimerase/dehydratase [Aureimonas sp. Leaf454]KQT54163.1 hypothetical protein ASG43_00585 [Aureimonas sp. Leaf454]